MGPGWSEQEAGGLGWGQSGHQAGDKGLSSTVSARSAFHVSEGPHLTVHLRSQESFMGS